MSAVSRAMAAVTPRPTPREPAERDVLQRERARSAHGWLAAAVVGAHYAAMSAAGVLAASWSGSALSWAAAASALVLCVVAGMLVIGVGQLVLLVRAAPRRWAAASTPVVLVALGLLTAPLAPFLAVVGAPLHLVLPLVVAAHGIGLLLLDPSVRAGAPRPVQGVVLGLGAAISVLVVGLLDALVLLPMTLAPGVPLDALWSGMAAVGEAGGWVVPVLWAGAWAVALLVLGLGLLRARRGDRGSLGLLLGAAALAVGGLPVAEFSIGMGVADTFGTRGGMSLAYPAIALVATALVAASAALLIGARRSD
ncbi:hypothetical protein [Agrococcus sp. Marseille-Q4369]|uniref:hypothetical protein n=1 Tax=Agrococcus sp. Marseille-Q4369 TaxID=2810513 RepID=UPI001B8CEDDB|nr:hypothetical protein [Agrococcus sp. Marseille-Q4369]QUW18027.1 hypothetical protein JSQ78_09215 [Agrococcus sp. Marseille-Q4369]